MKKKFKVILCVLLAVVLLMGCGKTEKPEVSSEEKFAEAKVEESSVQEASKAETESSQEESKASDIGSEEQKGEESIQEDAEAAVSEPETSSQESSAESASAEAESSAEAAATESSAEESSAVEESTPPKEKVKYGAYAAEEGDVTINGSWYLPDNGWGFGYYYVDLTSHLSGNNVIFVECSFKAADGNEIYVENAVVDPIAEGETTAAAAYIETPIEGYAHIDLTVYYVESKLQSGISDVEMNTYFRNSGAAVEVINKGNYVLEDPTVTLLLFNEAGELCHVDEMPLSNNAFLKDGYFGIYVGGKNYENFAFPKDHPYTSAKFYFNAKKTDLTTQASYIGNDEIEIVEQYTKGDLYAQFGDRIQAAFVLKNVSGHTVDFAYCYVLRDAKTGEFLDCGDFLQNHFHVLIPGQVVLFGNEFIKVEGHPDVKAEIILYPKDVDPNDPVSITSNLAFDYTVQGRGLSGTFTNNDPERTMETYGFDVIGFDEAGELVCYRGYSFTAQPLAPGESRYIEVLDIPYLLPEEAVRVEVFPFVTW